MQCTWSSNSESCDRCRRLEKRCHLRKSTIKEEPIQDGNSDTAMSQSEMYPLSDSAAAALALTELSAASEDRKSPVKPSPMKEPSPYDRQSDHVNPYQVGGRSTMLAYPHDKEPEYKPHIPHTSSPSRFYPKEPLERTRLPSLSSYAGPGSTTSLIHSPPLNLSHTTMDGGKAIAGHKRKVSRK